MTNRLTKEFKSQVTEFMLDTSKQLILINFDKNDKYSKTINIVNDTNIIEITRNCFTSEPYFEDYYVSFSTIIQNQKVKSRFYLEWKNNNINTELIPSGDSKIKIKKCIG